MWHWPRYRVYRHSRNSPTKVHKQELMIDTFLLECDDLENVRRHMVIIIVK